MGYLRDREKKIIDMILLQTKLGLGAPGSLPFFCNGVGELTQPPPAHMGIPPYHHLDPTKAVHGLSRSPMYPFGSQYPYSVLPEVSQVASWHAQASMYSISNPGNPAASAGFRNYPPSLSIPPTSIPSDFYRFSPGSLLQGPGLPPHPGLAHHLVGTPSKHDAHSSHLDHNHRSSSLSDQKSSSDTHGSKNASDSGQSNNSQNDKKKPHIKKPLNAFMLYMKEMRAKVVAECTLKESAAINQILGRRWHSLSREEQAKYYEKARQERQLHMQMYPGWSARDNYGYGAKKKKRKKEKTSDGGREEQAKYYELARRERQLHMQMYPNWSSAQSRTHHEKKRKKKQEKFDGGNSMKKCRARYGLDQQSQWCKPCRRKKKCIRYLEGDGGDGGGLGSPDDNLGSAGSAGEACTPDSKTGMDSDMDKSSDMGMSSPNFSLTSPGMSLASPGMSLTSPGMSLPSPALTSPCPSGILPSPASLASPAVSLPSLQSPMTPSLDDRHPISSVGSTNSSANFTTTSTSSVTTSSSSSCTSPVLPLPPSLLGLSAPLLSSSSSKNHLSNHSNNHHSHHNHHLGHLFNNNNNGLPLPLPLLPLPKGPLPHRNPVGANPHDINNPLSVNQLTGQCNSSSSLNSNSAKSRSKPSAENGNSTPAVIGVT
ncbi:unnamed protein product [Allacma fusca]|uniref:dTCF n=1 Tax=Allacma fusca TaxID=39272 RepID=A0A8J2L0F8_9HEXA|nr:unnamed protein product [Allacma fusca]